METTRASTPRLSTIFWTTALILCWALPLPSQQTNQPPPEQEPEHGTEAPKPKNEVKQYSLLVTVLGDDKSPPSPVKGAKVTVFAGEYQETNNTDGDGRISFEFQTDAKTATVRVRADRYKTDQQQIPLNATGKQQHEVVLKPLEGDPT
ncbi:MAG: hypothetical protein LAN83_14245 [Acidobacteriia bacterium]|nr:hypothetical protein [Terriglobia bacterium]